MNNSFASNISFKSMAATFKDLVEPIVDRALKAGDHQRRFTSFTKSPPLEIVKRDVDNVRRKDGSFLMYPGTKIPVMLHKGLPCSMLREMRYKAKRSQAGRWVN